MDRVVSFDLKYEEDTLVFGKRLASCLTAPLVLVFSGALGAGKTTLIRAMLRGLGVTGAVKSPTFSLVESYLLPAGGQLHHFDLYRIQDEAELEYIGFRDYFSNDAVCCIEWPERAPQVLSDADLCLSFQIEGTQRRLIVSGLSVLGFSLLSSLIEADQ